MSTTTTPPVLATAAVAVNPVQPAPTATSAAAEGPAQAGVEDTVRHQSTNTFFSSFYEAYHHHCQVLHVKPNSGVNSLVHTDGSTDKDITSLDFSGRNFLGPVGSKPLASALVYFPNLTSLNLSHNELNNDAITALALAIREHPSLQRVDLRENPISHIGGKALLQLLSFNRRIVQMDLGGTLLNPGVIKRVELRLKENNGGGKEKGEVGDGDDEEEAVGEGSSRRRREEGESAGRGVGAVRSLRNLSLRERGIQLQAGEGIAALWAATEATIVNPAIPAGSVKSPIKSPGKVKTPSKDNAAAAAATAAVEAYSWAVKDGADTLILFEPVMSILHLQNNAAFKKYRAAVASSWNKKHPTVSTPAPSGENDDDVSAANNESTAEVAAPVAPAAGSASGASEGKENTIDRTKAQTPVGGKAERRKESKEVQRKPGTAPVKHRGGGDVSREESLDAGSRQASSKQSSTAWA